MKFTPTTLQILKNYSTINHGIQFLPGNKLSTISTSKTVMSSADIEETIPSPFAIYELSKFLSTLSLFADPELDIKDKYLEIKEGKKKVKYTFADPSVIVTPPQKEIKFPDAEVEFDLLGDDFTELMKALSVLSLPEIAITGDGKNINVRAIDSKNPSENSYNITVGETEDTFNMIIKAEYLRMIPGDYHVEISSKGLSRFTGKNIVYFAAVESSSTYG